MVHTNCINRSFNGNISELGFCRCFSLVPDPEYCDQDTCNREIYKGLPEWVYLPWSEIKQLDNNHWQYDGVYGKFIIERYQYHGLVF